jgi:hypothetical protein
MPDSRLNEAERSVQLPFRNPQIFNGLVVFATLLAVYQPIRALPARRTSPPATLALGYRPVELDTVAGPLRLAGAWKMTVADPRFGGISGLAIDRGSFVAVSDRGSVMRFDRPGGGRARAWLADLRDGPGPWGRKWSRDAESLAADPKGLGWWVGYEQNHSLWLYSPSFERALANIDLRRDDWWNNSGAEGLIAEGNRLLVVAENGREAMLAGNGALERLTLDGEGEVADAARAPDGKAWLLLRSKGMNGITQSIAPLTRTMSGYGTGDAWPVPKGAFDNYEGMAIERRSGGGLRFWLVTDDGHRIMARTLLVALDYVPPARYGKGPATSAGPSKNP